MIDMIKEEIAMRERFLEKGLGNPTINIIKKEQLEDCLRWAQDLKQNLIDSIWKHSPNGEYNSEIFNIFDEEFGDKTNNCKHKIKTSILGDFSVEKWPLDQILAYTQLCEKSKHKQQVAFSTFENTLTQVCFTCSRVRTSINTNLPREGLLHHNEIEKMRELKKRDFKIPQYHRGGFKR